MSYHIIHARTALDREIAYRCHHDWYVAAGYMPPQVGGLYQDEFTPRADYYLACTPAPGQKHPSMQTVAGVVRLIHQHPMPLFIDFELSRLAQVRLFNTEPSDFMEISALSWRPGNAHVLPHLYRAIWQGALSRNRHWLIASLDDDLLAQFKADGLPFRVAGQSRCYMGSWTTPVYFHTEQIAAAVCEKNPALWALMQRPLNREQAVCI